MIDKNLLLILICPVCRQDLEPIGDVLGCSKCLKKYRVVDGIPIFFGQEEVGDDLLLAHEKWGVFYQGFDWEKELKAYSKNNLPFILKHLEPLQEGLRFVEIGSGPSFLCFELAKKGVQVIAIDFDISILRMAKKYFEQHNVPGYFICANIQNIPLRSDTVDMSAGIGVIEHSNDVALSLKELYRVTQKGGFTFQTVPALSLTTIILNQRYGTIPHIPVLKQIFILFHIKLLRAHHMIYGYEESFTRSSLRKLFLQSGFDATQVGFYDYGQTIAKKVLGNRLRPLIKLRLFWDIIFVKAHKKR